MTTEWHREIAAKIAAANPLERPSRVSQIKPGAIKARGALLAADNDESEAARVSRAKCEASDAVALRLQQMYPDPWGL